MDILSELRRAVRQLLRTPTFTLAAVLTLALGIGGTTAIYAVLRGVVLDPLPYPDADRLIRIKNPVPGVDAGSAWDVSSAQYFQFREHGGSLEELGAFSRGGATVRVSVEAGRGSFRQELLWATRALHSAVLDLSGEVAEEQPQLGRQLRQAAGKLLLNVERAIGSHESSRARPGTGPEPPYGSVSRTPRALSRGPTPGDVPARQARPPSA